LTTKTGFSSVPGFAFGVMFTMLVLAGVVGVALYVLAFQENRLQVPVGGALRAEAAASEAASGRGENERERAGEGSTGEDTSKQ
jgi:hypothetical protein